MTGMPSNNNKEGDKIRGDTQRDRERKRERERKNYNTSSK
jgi:hypothetical protein